MIDAMRCDAIDVLRPAEGKSRAGLSVGRKGWLPCDDQPGYLAPSRRETLT